MGTSPRSHFSARVIGLALLAVVVTTPNVRAFTLSRDLSRDADARVAGKEVRIAAGSSLTEAGVKRAINDACAATTNCRVVEMGTNESTGRVQAMLLAGSDTASLTHRLSEASQVPISLSLIDTGVVAELELQLVSQRAELEIGAFRIAQKALTQATRVAIESNPIDSVIASRDLQIQALRRAAEVSRVVLDVEPTGWWAGSLYERREFVLATLFGSATTVAMMIFFRRRRSQVLIPEWDQLASDSHEPSPRPSLVGGAIAARSLLPWSSPYGRFALALQHEKPVDFLMDAQNNLGSSIAFATPSVGGLESRPSAIVATAVTAQTHAGQKQSPPKPSDPNDSAQQLLEPHDPISTESPVPVPQTLSFEDWKRRKRMTKSPLTPYANTHSLSLADWLDDNKSKPRAALSPLERITATGYPLPPIRAWASALKVMWAAPEIWDVEMRAGKAASLGRVALALSEASAHHAIVPTDRQQQRDTARAVVLAAIAGLSPTDVACVATGGSQFTTRSLLRARMLVMRTPTPTVSENQVGAEAIAALARAFGIDVVVVPNEHRSPEDFTFHVQPLSTQYPKVEPKLEVDVLW